MLVCHESPVRRATGGSGRTVGSEPGQLDSTDSPSSVIIVWPWASHAPVWAPVSSPVKWEVSPDGLQGPVGCTCFLESLWGFGFPPMPHPWEQKTEFPEGLHWVYWGRRNYAPLKMSVFDPPNCECAVLHGKRYFANAIRLRTLRWGG